MVDVLLLQPPPGDLTGPYPALPYLKSYAEQLGYKVLIKDISLEAFSFLTQESQVRELLDRAEAARKELEAQKYLEPNQQRRYGLLLMAMGLGLDTSHLHEALDFFRNRQNFFNYNRYKTSCLFLNAFFRLLSAVHFPTEVTPSEYPRARVLQEFETIMAHKNRTLNPYIDYYKKILFPQISADPPAVIGVSMVFGSQSVQALVLSSLIMESFPEIHLTMGGAYLSQWIMLMGETQLTRLFTCTDSIICGEGEKPLTELLKCILNRNSISEVPNLITADSETGQARRFTRLDYTDITTQPPPDFTDLDLGGYLIPKPVIPYSISRGCYWGRCVFCQNRYGDNQMRRYQTIPVEKAVEELSMLAEQHDTDHFNFSNDVIDPTYLKLLSQALLDAGKKFIWNTDLRAEEAFTPELCQLMAKAGLNSVAIGFESGCQKNLDAMDKGYRIKSTRAVMKNLYESGVATQAMGFFGFPGESFSDGQTTVKFLEENVDRISYYVMGLLLVLPGSRMYLEPEKYGVDSISFEANPMMTPEPVWRSKTRMSVSAVNKLYQQLRRLENIYSLNDYPYVGALSTNHSFLYFEKGPDILKRLRKGERERHLEFHRILGIDEKHKHTRKSNNTVVHFAGPFMVYHSPFPVERIPMDAEAPPSQDWLPAGPGGDYLIDQTNMPIRLGASEKKILRRIDGRRNLSAILHKIQGSSPENPVFFLMQLLHRGLVVV